jgi:hypothetical protein
MEPVFKPGKIVSLRADSLRHGPIIEILPSIGEQFRYRVFQAPGDIREYQENQLVPVGASPSSGGVREAVLDSRWLDVDVFRARLTAARLAHSQVDNLYALHAARIQSIPFQFKPLLRFVEADRLRLHIADEVGVGKTIEVGLMIVSQRGKHKRGIHGFDSNCTIVGLKHAIQHLTLEKAAYIWNEILIPHRRLIYGEVESSSNRNFKPATLQKEWSKMGEIVRNAEWLPDRNGTFHCPATLSLGELPDKFQRDNLLAATLELQHTPLKVLAQEVGVNAEDIMWMRNHPEEFAKFRDSIRRMEENGNGGVSPDDGNREALHYPDALTKLFSRPQLCAGENGSELPNPVTHPELYRARSQEAIAHARQEEPR